MPLSWPVRIYIFAIDSLGVAALLWALYLGFGSVSARLLAYVLLAALSATRKIRLPGITQTISATYLVAVLAAVELSPAQAMLVAIAGALMQCYWRPAAPPVLHHVFFSLATTVLATGAACVVLAGSPASAFVNEAFMTVAAAAAYYAISASTLVVAAPPKESTLKTRGSSSLLWPFVHHLFGGVVVALQVRINRAVGWEFLGIIVPSMVYIATFWRSYLRQLEHEQELNLQKRMRIQEASVHLRTMEALALVVTAKSHDTDVRLQRAQRYARDIGQRLGLSSEELDALPAAALLQDIGYAAVPDYILAQQRVRTPAEEEKYQSHVGVGVEILSKLGFGPAVLAAVHGHHENWDGSGFPDGARGDQISVGARILRAINILDECCGGELHQADPLVKYSGRELDPAVVTAILAASREWDSAEPELLSSGEHRAALITPIAAAKVEDQSLFLLNQALGNSLRLEETLGALASRLPQLIQHDAIALYVCRGHKLNVEFSRGGTFKECIVGEGLAGLVALNGAPILNAAVDHSGPGGQLRTAVAVPLNGQERLAGILALYSHRAEAFSNEDLRILNTISGKLALSVENALQYQHVEQAVKTDRLTGLLNASGFAETASGALAALAAREGEAILLVCDLDRFKQLNDRFGHLTGNKALVSFATALRYASPPNPGGGIPNIAARFGGDEFVAFWPEVVDARDRIRRLQECAIRIGRETCGEAFLQVSVGTALYPHDGTTIEELLARADRSMFLQKDGRRQQVRSPN